MRKERKKEYMGQMKDSGIGYIGDIPKHWLLCSIDKASKVKSSKRVFEHEYSNYGIPFFRSKEIVELSKGKEISVELFIPFELYESYKDKYGYPKKGTLLITSIGTIGQVWLSDGRDFYYKDGNITQLEPYENLSSEFIKYCFESNLIREQYSMISEGSTLMALTIEKINKLKLLLPPLEEQQRIANFLDHKTSQLDSLISSKQTQIKVLSEYKQSLISETVTKGLNPDVKMKDSGVEWIGDIPEHWNTAKLNLLIDIQNGFPLDSKKFHPSVGFPLIRIRDLKEQEITMYYQGEVHDDYLVKKDDLLIGMDGDFNQCWWQGQEALINQRIMRVFDKTGKVDRKFLYYAFPRLLKLINDQTYSTTVKHLSSVDFVNNKIVTPPIQEQKKIVEFLDKKVFHIDTLINQIYTEIENLKEYKQSLIFEAVTGKKTL